MPLPPFWGPQTIARVPVKAIVPYLNERMLYQFQWGYRKEGRSLTLASVPDSLKSLAIVYGVDKLIAS